MHQTADIASVIFCIPGAPIAPARGPPDWDDAPGPVPDWDLLGQPELHFEFDQRDVLDSGTASPAADH